MPDVTLVLSGVSGAKDAQRLERAVSRLGAVRLVNVDAEKGLLAVSYEGGESELEEVRAAVEEAGFSAEPSPGADPSTG